MPAARARTGLVVPVPEAEAVVAEHRLRLDPNAALGVPAHVTVLFPFVPADALDDDVLSQVEHVVRQVPAFRYAFLRTDWFDDRVVWLAPEDPAPFRELTAHVAAAFPEHPPYEGAFPDVVPHLTVGEGPSHELLERAERAVRPLLPVTGLATEVVLLAESGPGGRGSSTTASRCAASAARDGVHELLSRRRRLQEGADVLAGPA